MIYYRDYETFHHDDDSGIGGGGGMGTDPAGGGVTVAPAALARIIEEDFASFLYRNERTLAWMRELKARASGVLRGGGGWVERSLALADARGYRFPMGRDARQAADTGEVSPDKTCFHAEYAWLNFNVAQPPPPLCRFAATCPRVSLDERPSGRVLEERPLGRALD